MPPTLTIGVPTCGRPRAVEACLASIAAKVTLEHRVIVVDSLITDSARAMYARYPTVTCIAREKPIGPSEARRLIAAATDTEYLLFLDDDNVVTPGSVEGLMRHLEEHADVGIVAGGWHEEGDEKKRALGQFFHFARSDRGPVVYKEFLAPERAQTLGLSACRVDGVQATMLVRRAIFDQVTFDPRYDFYFELYDFFLQCREKDIRIEALTGVTFDHRPVPYTMATLKQTSDRADDARRFAQKWGVEPWEGARPDIRTERRRAAEKAGKPAGGRPRNRSQLRRVVRRLRGR